MTQKREVNIVIKNPFDGRNKKRGRGLIDDVEIDSYLHGKKEMELKKTIWDLMFKEEMKRKKLQKQPTQGKNRKDGPAPKDVKTESAVEKKRSLSSKINYAALKELMGDEESNIGYQTNGEFETETERHEVADFNVVGCFNESECNEVGDFDGANYEYDSDYEEKY